MIEADKRKAVFLLHQEGMSIREISRRLGVSRGTVKVIIEQGGEKPKIQRKKKDIDEELLRRLYAQCEGFVQRVHEKLSEEEGIEVKYSSLTRMLREKGISKSHKTRCDRVADEPGAEMQHDTTMYTREVGGKRVKLVASILYLRYSKRRYLKFYRSFNRFAMKTFFHEALLFWGYSAPSCIIDNTNLARLRYSGKNAVIAPEMESFGKTYGFQFKCHAINHPNRKAGEERCFWTTETNFLPGRTFASMEDLNEQGFEWATKRMEYRPQSKTGLIPAKAFEHECNFLTKLPEHLPAPYCVHERGTDQYGYVAFGSNYYWVPGTKRDTIKVLEYADHLKLCKTGETLAEYPLPPDGTKNKLFSPEGQPLPRHSPKNRHKPTQDEEKRLRDMSESVNDYLDFAIKPMGQKRHRFLRRLFALSRKTTQPLFVKSIERAHKYKIIHIETIERIVSLSITQGTQTLPLVDIDEQFRERSTYQEGRLTDRPNLSNYEDIQEDNHE